MILVVDDLRVFPFPCVYARTSTQALDILRQVSSLDELFLDHDLGGADTIMSVVDYLRERDFFDDRIEIGRVYIHSANPPGGDTIYRALNGLYPVARIHASELGGFVP